MDVEKKTFTDHLNIFMATIWKGIGEKGKFTTLLGLAIIIAAVVDPLIKHNIGVTFSEDYMWQTMYFVIVGIVLIILPSEISISKTDGFKIKD